jgi:hypothetical protein
MLSNPDFDSCLNPQESTLTKPHPTKTPMKKKSIQLFTYALIALLTPLVVSAQTTFFSDSFTNGSTINSATPANPTPTNTAYETISSKSQNPASAITSRDLKFGIAATTSGSTEIQALFATNSVALTQPGDYIQLTVVFTNTAGLLTGGGALGFGLYNSGQIKPVPSGTNKARALRRPGS